LILEIPNKNAVCHSLYYINFLSVNKESIILQINIIELNHRKNKYFLLKKLGNCPEI
jgi:hypothetical protein